ncbi:MAG: hypothetical protein AAB383_02130 [Patescibacteria group bacterium]
MQILLWTLILVSSLAVAAAASQVFAAKAEEGARASKLSPFFWGVVLMALGVSLPELVISTVASAKGYSSFVPAYVWGANLVNLLLIMGICALTTRTLSVQKESTIRQVPLLLGTLFLLVVLSADGSLTAIEGGVLLLALGVFLAARREDHKQGLMDRISQLFNMEAWSAPLALTLLLSAAALVAGAYFTVTGVIEISEMQNWLPSVLGGSVVALGVSAPEMLLAHRAAKRGNGDAVVSLLVASTVLNATLVMAIPSFFGTLNVTGDTLNLALPFLLIALILFTFSTLQKKWSAYEGALMILLYLVFLLQFINPLFS